MANRRENEMIKHEEKQNDLHAGTQNDKNTRKTGKMTYMHALKNEEQDWN